MVPGYQSLSEVASAMGCVIQPWGPTQQPDGSLAFDVGDLAPLISDNTRVSPSLPLQVPFLTLNLWSALFHIGDLAPLISHTFRARGAVP